MFDALAEIDRQKENLQNMCDLGILHMVDATKESEMISAKELIIKTKLVDEAHVTKDGKPRTIRVDAKTGDVYTKLQGGRLVKAKSIDKMYIKLYEIYYGDSTGYTVEKIFELALKEKETTENLKQGTVKKYETDYKRFVSPQLSQKNIASITVCDLKAYTQKLVNDEEQITGKAYLAYKGILNLIFDYAMLHKVIKENPVSSIKNAVYLKSCNNSRPTADEKIFSPEEIRTLEDEVDRRQDGEFRRWGDYYIYGYAMKFSIKTGVRVGELCSLKWKDVDYEHKTIHIHAQQLSKVVNHKTVYYYVPYTKDEKGISNGGRYFPLTDEIRNLLDELADKQAEKGINSEYIFCDENGEWIKTLRYGRFLRKLCKKFGFNVTNNHGFRMSLNSNVLLPMGLSVADRAKLLGHSVETNLKHYSFESRDYVDKARCILDKKNEVYLFPQKVYPKILRFKSSKSL